MGAVYRAHDAHLNRAVAVKCLFAAGEANLRTAALREAKLLATISHPSVLQVFDAVADGNAVWIVSEWLDGATVADLRGSLGARGAAACLAQVLEALATLHGARIIHRDLKPSNIMVTKGGRAKLIDFGVAFHPTLSTGETLAGSLRYTDPRILAGAMPDAKSDLYAAGLLLLELLAGQPVWPALAPLPLFRMIKAEGETRLKQLSQGLHPELAALAGELTRQAMAGGAARAELDAIRAATMLRAWLGRAGSGSGEECLAAAVRGQASEDREADRAAVRAKLSVPTLKPRERAAWIAYGSALDMDSASLSLTGDKGAAGKWPRRAMRAAACIGLAAVLAAPGAHRDGGAKAAAPVSQPVAPPPPAPLAVTPPPDARPTRPPRPESRPASPQVRIVTNAWADLFIDGASAGRVPRARPFALAAGRHHLEFRSPFVETLATDIEVDRATARLAFTLTKVTREVRFLMRRPGILQVDGARVGQGLAATARLGLGAHVLKIVREGEPDERRSVVIGPSTATELHLE